MHYSDPLETELKCTVFPIESANSKNIYCSCIPILREPKICQGSTLFFEVSISNVDDDIFISKNVSYQICFDPLSWFLSGPSSGRAIVIFP